MPAPAPTHAIIDVDMTSPPSTQPPPSQSPPSTLPFPPTFTPHTSEAHTLHALTVISSSKIHAKVTLILSLLYQPLPTSTPETSTTTPTALIALTAKSSVANKLISIVEILKRHVESENTTTEEKKRLYQYTTMKGVMEARKEAGGDNRRGRVGQSKKRKRVEAGAVGSEAESEDAFVTQAMPVGGREEREARAVPYLTVYLSGVPVRELREAYGEQSV